MSYAGTFLPVIRLATIAGGLCLCAGLALAAEPGSGLTNAAVAMAAAAGAPLSPPPAPSMLGPLVRMLGALALVVGLLFAAQWFLRQQRRLGVAKGLSRLNILEVKPLGQRHALYVVGYEQQRLLVAASPTGVSLISALPDAAPAATDGPPAEPAVSFSDALFQVMGRR